MSDPEVNLETHIDKLEQLIDWFGMQERENNIWKQQFNDKITAKMVILSIYYIEIQIDIILLSIQIDIIINNMAIDRY